MSSEDQTRYIRAQLVVLDVFARVMRDLLKNRVSSSSSLTTMTQQKKFRKLLTKEDETMVKSIGYGNYDGLDIGVMYKIFRFFNVIPAPLRGWGYTPIPKAITAADDLERIRIYRNILMHKTKPSLTKNEMDSMFDEFKGIGERFDSIMHLDLKNGYAVAVYNFRTGEIDPSTERRYENELIHLKEQYSVKHSDKRITIHFGRPIQNLFSSDYPAGNTRLKVYLPGVIDPENVTKVLTGMIMEIVQMNYDIILDNIAEGSLVLYVTLGNAITLDHLGTYVLEVMAKANTRFTVPDSVEAVLIMSDPLIDNFNHHVFKDVDDALFDEDSTESNGSDDDCSSQIEAATFRMAETRLDSKEVENALKEQATKVNMENIKKELRLIIIGKIGVGKSALGNFICGKEAFHSEVGLGSVTHSSAYGRCIYDNRRVILIDTPGIFGTEHDSEHVETEIRKCIGMGCPGPNAILFVLSLADRFKIEDRSAIREFLQFFGKNMLDYVIVVFTHADVLTARGKSIEEHLQESPNELKDLLSWCGNRYVYLDTQSKGSERDKKLKVLFQAINTVRVNNFEDENFRATEKMIEKLEEEKTDEVIRRLDKLEERIEEKFESMLTETVMMNAFKRLKSVRDEIRTDIEHNQAQYVINESKLSMHKSVIKKFTDG